METEHKGSKYVDSEFIGQKFGRLTVIGFAWPPPENKLRWRVRCDCGAEKLVQPTGVATGRTKSCGCIRAEMVAMRGGDLLRYKWEGIVGGCCDPSHPFYKNMGGRGISVCDEWKGDYDAFRAWALENGWEDGKCIARKDTSGDYTPENCVCCTRAEVAQLHGTERIVVYWGEERRLNDLCKEKGLSLNTVRNRLKRGWTVEDAIDRQPRKKGVGVPARERGLDDAWVVLYYGELWGLATLCKRKGIKYSVVADRLRRGVPLEKAVDTPVGPYHRRKFNKKKGGKETT